MSVNFLIDIENVGPLMAAGKVLSAYVTVDGLILILSKEELDEANQYVHNWLVARKMLCRKYRKFGLGKKLSNGRKV